MGLLLGIQHALPKTFCVYGTLIMKSENVAELFHKLDQLELLERTIFVNNF